MGEGETGGESLVRALLLAIAPTVAAQIGEGIRGWLRARRELTQERPATDVPCDHGRPGGRLCAACWAARERDGG